METRELPEHSVSGEYWINVYGGKQMNDKIVYRVAVVVLLLLPLAIYGCKAPSTPPPGEKEATEYLGTTLTPISHQNNNAIKGTQIIDRETYHLTVDGLVETPLSLSYDDLLALPQESRLNTLNCVEGWNFVAKWTGPTLASILDMAKVQPGAATLVFHTRDVPEGYSSLELSYILDNRIIIALKLNDLTMPQDRGFPFQVVADGKYGYKWAKWVDRIEVISSEFKGYWESYGYNNNADINGPAYEGP
jgi:DMSO/TMAO reductase YedYZ molybdopterin-dependent catalytic subunit